MPLAHSAELEVLMATYPDRSTRRNMRRAPRVIVDRVGARTAAWYEFFPAFRRRTSATVARPSAIVLPRVDDAKAMGFDVIYFPPIHPIGRHQPQRAEQFRDLPNRANPAFPTPSAMQGSNGAATRTIEPSARHAGGFRLAGR